MAGDKRGAEVRAGDEILLAPGAVWTATRDAVVVDEMVYIATERGLLSGGCDAPVRVVAP